MEGQRVSDQKPIVSGSLCTFYPGFRELFAEILRVLLSHGAAYTPDTVGGRALGGTVPFRQDELNELFQKWKDEDPRHPFWVFERKRPSGIVFLIGDTMVPFRTVVVNVRRDFLAEDGKTEELLRLLKDLYALIHPMYGEISIPEMVKRVDSPLGKVIPGTDLEKGLPDISWANFLGPEYVEVFGPDKVFSAPCHSVEDLADGGALLLLSRSPFDYLASPEDLDRRRLDIKKHLGLEAFRTGDASYRGRVPKFRYHEQWKAEQAKHFARHREQDLLSKVPRSGWKDWVQNNEPVALAFVSEMEDEGLTLDFSQKSLDELDRYSERSTGKGKKWSLDFVKKLGAYLTQMVIKQTGAEWSYLESEEIPSLRIEGVILTPLARVLKVLEQGEKLGQWYRALNKTIPRLQAPPASESKAHADPSPNSDVHSI